MNLAGLISNGDTPRAILGNRTVCFRHSHNIKSTLFDQRYATRTNQCSISKAGFLQGQVKLVTQFDPTIHTCTNGDFHLHRAAFLRIAHADLDTAIISHRCDVCITLESDNCILTATIGIMASQGSFKCHLTFVLEVIVSMAGQQHLDLLQHLLQSSITTLARNNPLVSILVAPHIGHAQCPRRIVRQ